MIDELPGLPDVTRDIFVEFIEKLIEYYVRDSRVQIGMAMRGKRRFFSFQVTDFGLVFQIEGTPEGDIVIHWKPANPSHMEYIADSKTFDNICTGRVSAAEAYLRKKVKVKGSVNDAIRYLELIANLQKAYIGARQEIAEKYSLRELASQYPIPIKAR